jgi:hypothetical protein
VINKIEMFLPSLGLGHDFSALMVSGLLMDHGLAQ